MNNITKEIRSKLKLPITKDIVYYPVDDTAPVRVIEIIIEKEWPSWNDLTIILENGKSIRIHGDYLKEMQSPRFVRHEF